MKPRKQKNSSSMGMNRTGHTATYKGMWCKVKLKNGEEFIDKFLDRTKGKKVVFEKRTVGQGDIFTFIPICFNYEAAMKRYAKNHQPNQS